MKKITRQEARKRYLNHEPFIMVPGNYRPDSWAACLIDASDDYYETNSFDSLCNAFLYYNGEISKRISFYAA